jgi:uncharacterized protein with HEPN domain
MDNNFLENRDLQILKKILSEIKLIENWCVALDKNLFLEDELTQRAITMTLINIGELVKNLSEEIRKQNPNIPWRSISGMRDIAAHKYQSLKMEDVWITINSDLLKFKLFLLGLIESELL